MRAAADPAVGVLGPMVYHHDEPTVIQSAGGLLDGHFRAWHTGQNEDDTGQFPAVRNVDWISGCAILVRPAVPIASSTTGKRPSGASAPPAPAG